MPWNMHRAGNRPEWEDVAPRERNVFQRIGAATKSVVTPGNIATAAGAVMGGKAIAELSRGHDAKAAVWLAGSLIMDAADGWLADRTGTKTPLGAALDPIKDKLLHGAAVPVLARRGAVSKRYAAASLAINGVIALTTLHGRAQGHSTEVDTLGKVKTIAEGAYLVGALTEHVMAEHGEATPRLHAVNRVLGAYSLVAASVAAVSYVESATDH